MEWYAMIAETASTATRTVDQAGLWASILMLVQRMSAILKEATPAIREWIEARTEYRRAMTAQVQQESITSAEARAMMNATHREVRAATDIFQRFIEREEARRGHE